MDHRGGSVFLWVFPSCETVLSLDVPSSEESPDDPPESPHSAHIYLTDITPFIDCAICLEPQNVHFTRHILLPSLQYLISHKLELCHFTKGIDEWVNCALVGTIG